MVSCPVPVSARSGTNNNTWLQSPRDVNHVTLTQGSREEDVRNVRKVRKSELKRAQEQVARCGFVHAWVGCCVSL